MDIRPNLEKTRHSIVRLNDIYERRALIHDGMPILSLTRTLHLWQTRSGVYPQEVSVRNRQLTEVAGRLGDYLHFDYSLVGNPLRGAAYENVVDTIVSYF